MEARRRGLMRECDVMARSLPTLKSVLKEKLTASRLLACGNERDEWRRF